MELLLVLLAAPLVWMLLAPVRMLSRLRLHPFLGAGLFVALLVAAWLGLSDPGSGPSTTYATGDIQLRAMLE